MSRYVQWIQAPPAILSEYEGTKVLRNNSRSPAKGLNPTCLIHQPQKAGSKDAHIGTEDWKGTIKTNPDTLSLFPLNWSLTWIRGELIQHLELPKAPHIIFPICSFRGSPFPPGSEKKDENHGKKIRIIAANDSAPISIYREHPPSPGEPRGCCRGSFRNLDLTPSLLTQKQHIPCQSPRNAGLLEKAFSLISKKANTIMYNAWSTQQLAEDEQFNTEG